MLTILCCSLATEGSNRLGRTDGLLANLVSSDLYMFWQKLYQSLGGRRPSLTQEWLKAKWLLVEAEQKKVIECSKARGYKMLK
jgi:hypothetical protein